MCHWFDSGSGHYFFVYSRIFDKENFRDKKDGLLAQAVEHLTFNQGVAGSSPAWLSIRIQKGNRRIAFFVGFLV